MDFWVSKICLEWWIPFTALNRFSFSNRHYNMGLNKLPWWKGPASAVLFCSVYVQKYASRSVVWAQVPEVDTAVRSLTVMWDGSLVVAANNHGTCYVWRLLRGNQVVALVIHFSDVYWYDNSLKKIWLTLYMFCCRLWPTLSHFTSYKHMMDTFLNVSFHLSFVSPTG